MPQHAVIHSGTNGAFLELNRFVSTPPFNFTEEHFYIMLNHNMIKLMLDQTTEMKKSGFNPSFDCFYNTFILGNKKSPQLLWAFP
ncbi:hypothetical protein ABEF88_07435 [Acinetobacter thermotolerans]